MGQKDQSAGANIFSLFKQKGSRYYSMRIMHRGKRRRFSTGETNIKNAKAKARVIMADIQSRGFDGAVRIHSKRRDTIPVDPTIAELGDLYRSVSAGFDSPPSRPTRERYIRSLERVANLVSVKRISRLDENKVERFKEKYLKAAKVDERKDSSARVTLNGILRNAAALFSTQAIQGYKRRGIEVTNPFIGSRIKGVRLVAYSPLPREVIDDVWKSATKLRDGDEGADGPDETLPIRDQIDFREPHQDAYVLLVLELGLGLRRNEADKAEWSWFFEDANGRRFIEVRETPFFQPKSKQSRVIPVDASLWDALQVNRIHDRFVVDGPEPVTRDAAEQRKSAVYRCDRAHRTLVVWLRRMGVDDAKPCHRLRKEFGSYVSTTFGLFHAQRFLGHSSPNVTSDYYAGLTELPELKSMPAKTTDAEKKAGDRSFNTSAPEEKEKSKS